jgi:hypothetical protein
MVSAGLQGKPPTSFIYALVCPIEKRIRYVGKTNLPSRRILQHIQDGREYRGSASLDSKKISTRAAWIASLLRMGLEPQMVILEEVPRGRWESKEKEWIKRSKEAGCHLFNRTPGGAYIPKNVRNGNGHTRKKDYRKKKGRSKYTPPPL